MIVLLSLQTHLVAKIGIPVFVCASATVEVPHQLAEAITVGSTYLPFATTGAFLIVGCAWVKVHSACSVWPEAL